MSAQLDDPMQTPLAKQVREQVLAAKKAARPLARASADTKNAALLRMADDIEANRKAIQAEMRPTRGASSAMSNPALTVVLILTPADILGPSTRRAQGNRSLFGTGVG